MSLTLEEALASLRVVALPMKTKFRGLKVRETALFQGPAGWGEFAPFIEYDANESLPWLESAIEAATTGTYGNVIRLLPPLVMPEHLLKEALSILDEAIAQA